MEAPDHFLKVNKPRHHKKELLRSISLILTYLKMGTPNINPQNARNLTMALLALGLVAGCTSEEKQAAEAVAEQAAEEERAAREAERQAERERKEQERQDTLNAAVDVCHEIAGLEDRGQESSTDELSPEALAVYQRMIAEDFLKWFEDCVQEQTSAEGPLARKEIECNLDAENLVVVPNCEAGGYISTGSGSCSPCSSSGMIYGHGNPYKGSF